MGFVTSLVLLFVAIAKCSALTRADMFAYGDQYQNPIDGLSNQLQVNVTNRFTVAALLDFYAQLTIPNGYPEFKIYGASLGRSVFINYNGHITFGNRHRSFDPFTINTTDSTVSAIFSPYFSDNDPRRPNGLIHYRLSVNQIDLNLANTLIRGRGYTTFSSGYCIIATWENMKYYVSNENQRDNPLYQQENTYQATLCTDGNDGHYIYSYLKLEWARSQDTSTNYATIGWHVKPATPSLIYWVAPSSGTSQSTTNMVLSSNADFNGRWMRTQAIVGECSGRTNGVYAKDCSTYIFCCNQVVDKTATCPSGTYYHSFTQSCVDSRNYNCPGTNFCDGKADDRYANTATTRLDDFYECKSQTTRLRLCPHGFSFGTNSRCN